MGQRGRTEKEILRVLRKAGNSGATIAMVFHSTFELPVEQQCGGHRQEILFG